MSLRIGLVGSRFAANFHAECYHRLGPNSAHLAGVYSPTPTSRADFAKRHDLRAVSSLEELLEISDVIDICSPPYSHESCVIAAAEAGKHVIVEQPMANMSEGIERMISAADRAGVALSPPYCWRAHPASRHIKRLVDGGVLGQLVALEGRLSAGSPARYDLDGISPWLNIKWLAGGGPMHNLGVHWIDLFRWMLDDEVESAVGMVSHLQPVSYTHLTLPRSDLV